MIAADILPVQRIDSTGATRRSGEPESATVAPRPAVAVRRAFRRRRRSGDF